MLKINDTNIVVNYIKQMLSSFNLPNFKVYKEGMYLYENGLYLKDDQIVQYRNGDFYIIVRDYIEGRRYLNYTKTFKNESLSYDSQTHEYLGEYLRFLRDYKNYDLMSMYNCYSKNYVKKVNVSIPYEFELKQGSLTETVLKSFELDTDNNLYTYIMIPVKVNQKYTIAIDSPSLEICCAFIGKGYYNLSNTKTYVETYTPEGEKTIKSSFINMLANKTYLSKNNTSFDNPFIYDNLIFDSLEDIDFQFLYEHENDLKLILKIPRSNTSSLVVLEGEYIGNNDFNFKIDSVDKRTKEVKTDVFKPEFNKAKLEFNLQEDQIYTNKNFKSRLQLLQLNCNTQFALSDRILAYLMRLPISNVDVISNNIKRLQKRFVELWKESEYIDSDKKIRHPLGTPFIQHKGVWDPSYQALLYSMAEQYGLLESSYDILGYLDKDLEIKIGELPEVD